jgi:hypothetical protein
MLIVGLLRIPVNVPDANGLSQYFWSRIDEVQDFATQWMWSCLMNPMICSSLNLLFFISVILHSDGLPGI